MVEHLVANEKAGGSSPPTRSILPRGENMGVTEQDLSDIKELSSLDFSSPGYGALLKKVSDRSKEIISGMIEDSCDEEELTPY